MQKLSYLNSTDLIKNSRKVINESLESTASNFSGVTFPTTNLEAGMFCYRTDRKKLYILGEDLTTWIELIDMNTGVVYVPNASNADAATKATGDSSGQKIVSTYVKSVTASGQTVVITKGDGTQTSFTMPNTTYTVFTGATPSTGGKAGLVPAPSSGQTTRFLRSDGTWFDAGTGDIGNGTKPVYMSSGKITASGSTVGSSTKPVYMSGGTITQSSSTVGSSTQPMYLSNGTFTACTQGTGMIPSVAVSGSTQAYRAVYGFGGNAVDTSDGSGNISYDYLRTNAGLGATTLSLQSLLQELVNRSHTHTIHRHYYNCDCNCDCNCGDNDN